ncbi:MAG: hypothetical protein ACXVP1_00990, partial [Thermoleophilia bacterium]
MSADSVTPLLLRALAGCYRIPEIRRRRAAATRITRQRRTEFYEAAWTEAAAAANGTMTKLGGGLLEIGCGGVRLRARNNLTSLDDAVTLQMAGDKPLVYGLLQEHAIPVPVHVVCSSSDLATARRFLANLGRPCVVKPARRTGAGAGITTGVRTAPQLVAALARAGAHCNEVIVEEEVAGANLRLLYLDGVLLDSVQRTPPVVCGDGTSSIAQLVERENADRLTNGTKASQTLLSVDAELRGTLRNQGYTVRSVPAAGTVVRLKSVVNDNRGDDNLAVDRLSADLVEVGARAAKAVGVRLAGVDVITPDPSLPLGEAGGVVIEVNTT